jgi:hypothetical protein
MVGKNNKLQAPNYKPIVMNLRYVPSPQSAVWDGGWNFIELADVSHVRRSLKNNFFP